MKCTVHIAMDNAAFYQQGELSRILRDLAERVEHIGNAQDVEPYDAKVRAVDVNGNTVGFLQITN